MWCLVSCLSSYSSLAKKKKFKVSPNLKTYVPYIVGPLKSNLRRKEDESKGMFLMDSVCSIRALPDHMLRCDWMCFFFKEMPCVIFLLSYFGFSHLPSLPQKKKMWVLLLILLILSTARIYCHGNLFRQPTGLWLLVKF